MRYNTGGRRVALRWRQCRGKAQRQHCRGAIQREWDATTAAMTGSDHSSGGDSGSGTAEGLCSCHGAMRCPCPCCWPLFSLSPSTLAGAVHGICVPQGAWQQETQPYHWTIILVHHPTDSHPSPRCQWWLYGLKTTTSPKRGVFKHWCPLLAELPLLLLTHLLLTQLAPCHYLGSLELKVAAGGPRPRYHTCVWTLHAARLS